LEPEELKSLVIETERAFLSIGEVNYGIQDSEQNSLKHKRSIYINKSIKK
jgi:N-acetylneuraminate synthase